MIESTFVLLKGIGDKTERRWWDTGVMDWAHFLQHPRIPGVSPIRKRWYDFDIGHARAALAARDSSYFAGCLRPRDHWRLFPLFREHAVYLDIETTGGIPGMDAVTVVGIHTHGAPQQFVASMDLTECRLNEILATSPLLVTFFGSVFDVPFLRRVFPGLIVPPLHFDLCFAARRLNLTGGLKALERQLGLKRAMDLAGLDGWDAVRLWKLWQQGDEQSLDQLLRYNRADTENLLPLADHLYDGLTRTYGPPRVNDRLT